MNKQRSILTPPSPRPSPEGRENRGEGVSPVFSVNNVSFAYDGGFNAVEPGML